ncbi:hypothetical protein FQZ97_978050 [compost metagenome]
MRAWSLSHQLPSTSIIRPPISPSTGAAKASVPKKGLGMAFWMAGVPGNAVMVKVKAPRAMAPGSRRLGMPASRNSAVPMG